MKIKIENVSFRYKSPGAGPDAILNDVNLEIDSGSMLAIVGPSGSGKSTLMQHLNGLLTPDAGRVLVDGVELAKMKHLTDIRRRIGLVFQFPETQLFAETVYDDVAFGPRNLGLDDREVKSRVVAALESMGLDPARFGSRAPLHLSEGEKRRVAIAGVLALQPECLVLDEPTAGMDHQGVAALMQILQNLHAQGTTVLLISHDLDMVVAIAERIVILDSGQILFDGTRSSLLGNGNVLRAVGLELPRAATVARALKKNGLVTTETLFTVEEIKRELQCVCAGSPPALE